MERPNKARGAEAGTEPQARFTTDHITSCPICGHPVPAAELSDHLLADERLITIMQATHPAWGKPECEVYLRSLTGANRNSSPKPTSTTR